MKKNFILSLLACFFIHTVCAQNDGASIIDGTTFDIEVSGTASSGENAPLWLSSNKYGIVSPYANSSYERVNFHRDMDNDSLRLWKRGYGVDIMLSQNAQSSFFIHQAYAEMEWKKLGILIGAKERGIDLRNDELTSGGLSHGINSAPIPMVLGEIDYFSIPGMHNWLKVKGRLGYGMTTDGRWIENWTADKNTQRYRSNILYHEKAIYFKIGREDKFPMTFDIGLQMMAQFGGTCYNLEGRGIEGTTTRHFKENLNAFWHAFWPMGSSDETDGAYQNAAGNTLGSYNMRLQWDSDNWGIGAYFERFFEDHSMLVVQYGIYDHLLGIEARLPKNNIASHLLIEHISTKDQSGAVYHDETANIPEQLAGRDNYYNHHIYSGWQHWGMAIGNPLLTSPIYNTPHKLHFYNNRLQAWHIGIDGDPCKEVHWVAKATFSRNWGTYAKPFDEIANDQHYMVSAQYSPAWAKDWSGTLAFAISHSEIIGNTTGAQLTVRKSIYPSFRKRRK